MKTIVIYYSLTGKTAEIAKSKAKEENADILELKDIKKFGIFKAFVFGAYKAMKQKKADLEPITTDLSIYDKIVIAMPIWASMPAPAFNNVVEILPSGKQVDLILTSAGGDSKGTADKISKHLESKGCKLIGSKDVKTGK